MAYKDCSEKDYRFLGIISSKYLENEMTYFKYNVEKDIDRDVNFLYVFSGKNKMQNIEYLLSKENLESEKNFINYKRENFDIDYLIGKDGIDKDRFLVDLEEIIKKRKNDDDNVVYITIDEIWTAKDKDEVYEFYSRLREIGDKYEHRFIVRYILNELNTGFIHGMMLEHECVLLRRKSGLIRYTARELLSKSMSTFSYYNEIEEEYREEMMRVEHLKSMGELTEGIVHDVNNLLTTVLGCLELIELNGYDDKNESYLNTIYKTVAEGSGIMNKVLSHMRGTKVSDKESIFLDDIVNFCLDMSYIKLKNLNNRKEIENITKLNSNSYVYVDEYDVRQAILNIIFNAVDAMPDGGVLEINTYDQGDRAILSIKDTGIGMSPGMTERIFDAYYTTKGDLGTGIGLNMTKKICESQNIEIEVRSEKGKGTEFILSFEVDEVMEDK